MLFVKCLSLSLFLTFVHSQSLPYAEWAHYHMVWLENSYTDQADIQQLFDNYTEYRIPFGTVNIDSRWATGFNTFIFDTKKFPAIRQMLDGFRSQNKHIVAWMTSMVNLDSPNYEYAQSHGFLFNKTIKWWHGDGRLLNYFNPEAVLWWHSQIANLLDAVGPIHAFKADGTDPYIVEVLDPKVTWEKYRTAYYNDTFQILRQLVGPEALIMSRPVDADLSYSPTDVVFMGWVGDNDGTYDGLKTALRSMLESGRRGYVGFGSDIGGYRRDPKAPLGRTKELLLRWAAVGALSSFMENGGGGEHEPWKFDNETVDIYRGWVNLHYNLVPYLYSQGTKFALGKNGTLMKACSDIQALGSHSYFLGPNIFVVPVVRDPQPKQTQTIWLPRSSTGSWINYFNTSIKHKASGFIREDTSRLDQIPLYVEEGSLITMYDLNESSSLNAFRFVLWGQSHVEEKSTDLFTRDGQHWRLEFHRSQQRLTVRFQNQYESSKRENWTWKFCQYINGQEVCSNKWMSLEDRTFSTLDVLI